MISKEAKTLDRSMLYTAKEAHVVIRWCDMSASDVADCLGVSCAVARSIKKNPGRLSMGQIELLARTMGKGESVLIKELIWCDAPDIADALYV